GMVAPAIVRGVHPTMKTIFFGAAAAAALLAACPALAQPAASAASSAAAPDLTKAQRLGTWGYDLSARDLSTKPGQDFFLYANGSYLKTLQIPADRTRYGAFDVLNELSQNRMRAVVEKAAADKAATGERAKVGALYRSYMGEAKVNAL